LLVTSILQFMLSTMHVVSALIQLIQGFVSTAAATPGASTFYFLDMDTSSLIGDGILVWRVYMVWRKDLKIVILPILLLLGTTVCSCKSIFNLKTLNGLNPLFLSRVISWLTALWAISLTTQALCTLLIAGRIWWDTRISKVAGFGSRRQMSAAWTIVESGAIYSICTVVLMTLFLLHTQAGAIIGDPLGQISVGFSSIL
ncbi:hypothetical protein GYMLUDRAFT_176450, partial [Collybiopsis luxurians FD-317 M1]